MAPIHSFNLPPDTSCPVLHLASFLLALTTVSRTVYVTYYLVQIWYFPGGQGFLPWFLLPLESLE